MVLSAPTGSSPYIMDIQLWTQASSMTDASYSPSTVTCTAFTYVLEYTAGVLWDTSSGTGPDISHLTTTVGVGSIDISGTIPDMTWVGSHYYKLTA